MFGGIDEFLLSCSHLLHVTDMIICLQSLCNKTCLEVLSEVNEKEIGVWICDFEIKIRLKM